jgi:3-methyl-2-oxobutanoate hydroxymethyltransferase
VGGEAARSVTAALSVPTIGIGSGPDCDGQVLVSHDMLGLFDGRIPSFVKQYARLADEVDRAAREYISDVQSGRYPEVPRALESRPR